MQKILVVNEVRSTLKDLIPEIFETVEFALNEITMNYSDFFFALMEVSCTFVLMIYIYQYQLQLFFQK